jgi:Alkylmercury lyase
VFAMCAIDALGIPQMLGRDAHISSIAPASGQPITVEVHHGVWRFAPPSTVVLDGRTAGGGPGGTVADRCCPHINFHLDRAAAAAYRRAHPGMAGMLLDQPEAVQAAGQAFGGLLDPFPPTGANAMTATQLDTHSGGRPCCAGTTTSAARSSGPSTS